MKTILELLNANPKHWVGNGFPVRTLFSYQLQEQRISPFYYWIMPHRSFLSPPQHVEVWVSTHTEDLRR